VWSKGKGFMDSERARRRAEKSFKQEKRAQNAEKAMAEYEALAIAIRKKTAHLKALRIAKAAHEPVAELRSGSDSVDTRSPR
jgi:hypothetical protein